MNEGHRRRRTVDKNSDTWTPNGSPTTTTSRAQQQQQQHGVLRIKFKHDARLLLFYFPCIVVILGLCGKILGGILAVGSIVAYVFHSFQKPLGVYFSMWFTLVVTEICIILSGIFLIRYSPFNLFVLFNMIALLALIGLWMSLQFQFVIKNSESLSLTAERALFATSLYPTTLILIWGLITIKGIHYSPFYYFVLIAIGYFLYGVPVKSSFRVGTNQNQFICNRVDNFLQTLTLLVQPSIFYFTIYHNVISEWIHLCNVFALICGGLLFIGCLGAYYPLSWTGAERETQEWLYRYFIHGSILALIPCFEYRVIFHIFYGYIQIPPPWSYIFITTSLYALYGLILLNQYSENTKSKRIRGLSYLVGVSGAIASSYVVSLPFYLYVCPIIGSISLVSFYWHKRLMEWMIFVFFFMLSLYWFMWANFMFVEYHFSNDTFSGITLSVMCKLLIASIFSSLLLPGFIMSNKGQTLNGVLFVLHSVFFVFMEWLLYSSNDGSFSSLPLYPAYLFFVSSLVVIVVARKIEKENRISCQTRWIVSSLYVSSYAVLAGGSLIDVACFFVVTISFLKLYVVQEEDNYKMPQKEGLFYFVCLFVGSFIPTTVYEGIASLFFTESHSALLFTHYSWLIIFSIGIIPLSFKFFRDISLLRKANLFLLLLGIILTFVDPIHLEKFLVGGGSSSGEQFMKIFGLERKTPLFLCMIIFVVSAVSGILPIKESIVARLFFSFGVGIPAGLLLPTFGTGFGLGRVGTAAAGAAPSTVVPLLLYILYPLLCVLLSIFLLQQIWPSSLYEQPTLYAAITALFPLIYVVISESNSLHPAEVVWFTNVLCVIYVVINGFTAALLKREQEHQPKRETTSYSALRHIHTPPPTLPSSKPTYSSVHSPSIGNVATFLCFGLSLYLCSLSLLVSPLVCLVLLLLQPDRFLFRFLSPVSPASSTSPAPHRHYRRFVPVLMAIYVIYDLLSINTLYDIYTNPLIVSMTFFKNWAFLIESACLFCVLVPQFFVIKGIWYWGQVVAVTHRGGGKDRGVGSSSGVSTLVWVLLLPLCVAVLPTTSVFSSKVMGVINLFVGFTLAITDGGAKRISGLKSI